MNHTGTVYLSRTPPQANHAACGAFQLQLLLYDRLGPHRVEPWRVTWTGNAAQRFWTENKERLVPGAAIVVELNHAQVHTLNCKPPRSEMHARMVCAALVPPRSIEETHG